MNAQPRESSRKRAVAVAAAAVCAGLAVLALLTMGEDRIAPEDGARLEALPLPFEPVREVAVERIEEPAVERYPGTVHAVQENVVASRILSTVREVNVRPGQQVDEGAVLVVLDSRDLEARANKAREEVEAARARLREAQLNFDRMKAALERSAVSRRDHDAAESAFLVARSGLDGALKNLEESEVALSYATIRAPFRATIIDRFVDPGDVATPGARLLTLYDPSHLRLEAFVRESVAVRLAPGDRIGVLLETADLALDGEITEIVPQAEAGSRSFLVKVDLPRDERLYPGMFGRLLFSGAPRERVTVPAAALVAVGQLRYVVMADARHTRRLVVEGPAAGDDRIEILSGLRPGERILAPGG